MKPSICASKRGSIFNSNPLHYGLANRRSGSGIAGAAAQTQPLGISTQYVKAAYGHTDRKDSDRGLFLDVLSATATKRDVRSYLSAFNPGSTPTGASSTQRKLTGVPNTNGVNLGNLYLSTAAVDASQVFSQTYSSNPFVDLEAEPLHTALVQFKSPQDCDDATLEGVGHTLSQLTRLGLSCVVVVDLAHRLQTEMSSGNSLDWKAQALKQAERVVAAIENKHKQAARCIDGILEMLPYSDDMARSVKIRGAARISNRELLHAPLCRGLIPVVPCVGYASDTHSFVPVDGSEVVLALTRELAGLAPDQLSEVGPDKLKSRGRQISLDRIIILDSHGGIPSVGHTRGAHVFINIEQEYEDIIRELGGLKTGTTQLDSSSRSQLAATQHNSNATVSHLGNLQLARDTLALLPPSSSALLTTPLQAATSSRQLPSSQGPGVGTRSQKNPLIHNLLTDRPVFSSSLPRTRISSTSGSPAITPTLATFIKRGMPVTMIPDPHDNPWSPPRPDSPILQLTDPRIDLPRLIHLIDDSFGRKLDAQKYLERISSNLAGIIIAGSYEGGAILTWEMPPGVSKCAKNRHRLVPYLDKFAVLRRSQGSGGVADIVFSAMVRDCFPHGVCWRSRRDNPVNKWYFERARGTRKIPVANGEQGWTMFWTTEGIDGELFKDYEGVCRSVGSSWADNKNVLD